LQRRITGVNPVSATFGSAFFWEVTDDGNREGLLKLPSMKVQRTSGSSRLTQNDSEEKYRKTRGPSLDMIIEESYRHSPLTEEREPVGNINKSEISE
jgi:hypothetical protein